MELEIVETVEWTKETARGRIRNKEIEFSQASRNRVHSVCVLAPLDSDSAVASASCTGTRFRCTKRATNEHPHLHPPGWDVWHGMETSLVGELTQLLPLFLLLFPLTKLRQSAQISSQSYSRPFIVGEAMILLACTSTGFI